jgi:2-iminobutanoate/2-iminopropanoate deaminase
VTGNAGIGAHHGASINIGLRQPFPRFAPAANVERRKGGSKAMSNIVRATSAAVPEPPPGTWSNCLVANGIAYIAGMTAGGGDTTGDEYVQAKTIFGKIRHLVEAAGGSIADVTKVTIFITDITQREKVWQARREFFTGNFPASTLVQVAALASPALKVEIEAVAHIGAARG